MLNHPFKGCIKYMYIHASEKETNRFLSRDIKKRDRSSERRKRKDKFFYSFIILLSTERRLKKILSSYT